MGIGSFGPIGIDPINENYGHILSTPKVHWTNFDFLGNMKSHFKIPIFWTTDVNAAAYGELKKGAAKGKNSCVYLNIGTGIGGGIIINRKLFQGKSHPEIGHIYVKRHSEDHYSGTCLYHHDCLEGLASGPSLKARTNIEGKNIPQEHPIWNLQAYYIAQALVNYTLTCLLYTSPSPRDA